MRKRCRSMLAAGVALTLAMTVQSAEPSAAPAYAYFSAPVTISATGKAGIGEISGVQGALADAVRTHLARVDIVPARRDGVAVESRMLISGRAVLTPADADDYALALDNLSVMPAATATQLLTPPKFPVDMYARNREGSVELQLGVDEAGRITSIRTVASTDASFEKAVLSAAKSWTFKPSGETAQFSVPVSFRLAEKRKTTARPKFECPLPAGQAYIAGQNGCISMIEVTGSRVRRTTTNIR